MPFIYQSRRWERFAGWTAIILMVVGGVLMAGFMIRSNQTQHDESRSDRVQMHEQIREGRADRRDLRVTVGELQEIVNAAIHGHEGINEKLDGIAERLDRLEKMIADAIGKAERAGF